MSERFSVPGPGGRTIEVLTDGDPDGFPLLFHGGTPSAVAEFPMLDEFTRALGLRVVTYSRPGYGESTARPAPYRYVDDVEESVLVLDHLGIDDFVTLGWSGGGPRALACAALLPGRCRAAATVSGVAPFHAEGLDWFDGMAEENHEEYHAAEAGPEAHEHYIVEHVLPMLAATPDELEEAFGGLVTKVDAAVLTADFADWLSRTFNHSAAQGADRRPRRRHRGGRPRGASSSPRSTYRSRSGRAARTRSCRTSTASGSPPTCPARRRTCSTARGT